MNSVGCTCMCTYIYIHVTIIIKEESMDFGGTVGTTTQEELGGERDEK